MKTRKALKEIGKKLREDGRDIVEAKLPERLAELIRRLEKMDRKALLHRDARA